MSSVAGRLRLILYPMFSLGWFSSGEVFKSVAVGFDGAVAISVSITVASTEVSKSARSLMGFKRGKNHLHRI